MGWVGDGAPGSDFDFDVSSSGEYLREVGYRLLRVDSDFAPGK